MREEGNSGVAKDKSRIGDMKEKLEHQKIQEKQIKNSDSIKRKNS